LKSFVINKEGKNNFRHIMREVRRKSRDLKDRMPNIINHSAYIPLTLEATLRYLSESSERA